MGLRVSRTAKKKFILWSRSSLLCSLSQLASTSLDRGKRSLRESRLGKGCRASDDESFFFFLEI
jgi:hypothetical protein